MLSCSKCFPARDHRKHSPKKSGILSPGRRENAPLREVQGAGERELAGAYEGVWVG